MKICPLCREEYLEHIDRCDACDQALVADLAEIESSDKSSISSKKEILAGVTIALCEGNLAHCREIEGVLRNAGVDCLVYPQSLRVNADISSLGASSEMKYLVLVKEGDLGRADLALKGRFYVDVAREGRGKVADDAIDLGQDMITCPACGERGSLNNGDCTSCGLTLGVPDDR